MVFLAACRGTANALSGNPMLRPVRLLARPALCGVILGGALALFLTAGAADARIGLGAGYPQRSNTPIDGRIVAPASEKDLSTRNAGINRADCYDKEQQWRFVFTSVPAGANTVEIWARTDNASCADRTQRAGTGATTPNCYRVAGWNRQDVALAQIVTLAPIQIIRAIDERQNFEAKDTVASLDANEICGVPSSPGMVPRSVYLHILPMSGIDVVADTAPVTPGTGTGTAATTDAVFHTIFDLDGPPPPTGLSAGAGNTLLVMGFTNNAQTVTDHFGFRAYCFPGSPTTPSTKELDGALEASGDDATSADTGAATDDASSTEDASSTDGATTDATSTPVDPGTRVRDSNCPAGDPFVSGKPPTAEMEKYRCGESGTTTGAELQITGLTNYVPYAVAIGAIDQQGNAGALSEVKCSMPKETVDFWSAYKKAGGTGGGGYCAFGHGKSAASALAAAAFGLALLARVGRRVRKPL